MQSPAAFREYAEECRRMANNMPQHRHILLEMAKAWTACADAAEKKQSNNSPEGTR